VKAAELFVRCLENEGLTHVFGIPGEENLDVMDAFLDSSVRFVTTRHEQGAAFMADVYGRLTGRAGVCLATLGPGATNLVTGIADANMDRAPVVAIAGQAATTRMHKESHQHLDLVRLFESVSKYSTQVRAPEIVPEVVRKAFKVAEAEKPGVSFIDFPEDVAALDSGDAAPLRVQAAVPPDPPLEKVEQAARVISEARYPIVMAGNGVIRARASEALLRFAERLNVPVATTFMAKGVIPFSHPLSLGAIGLQAHDHVSCGFDRADVIICVGYDMVEYHPYLWHPSRDKKIIHIDASPAEVDEHYILEVGVVGNIGSALDAIAQTVEPKDGLPASGLRRAIEEDFEAHAHDTGFPIKPQKILWDLRQVLEPDDIVISDVGAHKMWTARMYQAEKPNTCIISNGFASMGIAVPGAIGARVACRDADRRADLERLGVWVDQVEADAALRQGKPHRFLEPRFRPLRRELRGGRLPGGERRGASARHPGGARPRGGVGDRLPRGLFGEPQTDGEARSADLPHLKNGHRENSP
jgi:acetolactate synthase-1/2/3 large subunit